MWFLALFIVGFFASSTFATSACGVCGQHSGAMCYDDKTFAFCNPDGSRMAGRHTCPEKMKCVDNVHICVDEANIPAGTKTCETKCGKCSHNSRFACRDSKTFSLCYGRDAPSSIIHKCPTNTVCSTTRDPASKQFCFNPVELRDEDVNCFEHEASSAYERFLLAAAPSEPAADPAPVKEVK